jgi:hypothetical protein
MSIFPFLIFLSFPADQLDIGNLAYDDLATSFEKEHDHMQQLKVLVLLLMSNSDLFIEYCRVIS